MNLIGICGYARAGKDTVADTLRRNHQFYVTRFSATLKGMIKVLLTDLGEFKGINKLDHNWYYDWLEENKNLVPASLHDSTCTVRELMQTLGDDWARKMVHNDIWVRITSRRTQNYMDIMGNAGRVVWPDVRYPNELEALRELGGTLWHVRRKETAVMAHESERHIPEISQHASMTFHNNGSIEDLQAAVDLAWHAYGE